MGVDKIPGNSSTGVFLTKSSCVLVNEGLLSLSLSLSLSFLLQADCANTLIARKRGRKSSLREAISASFEYNGQELGLLSLFPVTF